VLARLRAPLLLFSGLLLLIDVTEDKTENEDDSKVELNKIAVMNSQIEHK
jgi:hypothetical protein